MTEGDPLKRRIAVSLAVIVALGGVLAILRTDASVNEATTAREATRTAVRAMRAHVVLTAALGVESGLHAERDFLPFRRPLTAHGSSLRAARRALDDDRAAPALAGLRLQAERATLRQSALATTRIAWNARSTHYTTVIALLAAALFLVGYGLIVEGPVRSGSYGLGVAIAVLAAGWAVVLHQQPIPSTPELAIEAAARGAALVEGGDAWAAVAEYDRAIRADGGYATAYTGRSRARLLAANPDYEASRAFTDVALRATPSAVRDARHALELEGQRDLRAYGLVAMGAFYSGDQAGALRAADRAIEINARVPDVWMLRSAGQTALGRDGDARASLGKALALLRGPEASQRMRPYASSYLSYLAWIGQNAPDRAAAVKRLADRVVAEETASALGRRVTGAPSRRGAVRVDDLRFAGGRMLLRLRWRALPRGTALSAIGYERPVAGGSWSQPSALALFATVGGTGRRRIAVPLRRVCEPTEVRVDVFLNGGPAISRTGPGMSPTC